MAWSRWPRDLPFARNQRDKRARALNSLTPFAPHPDDRAGNACGSMREPGWNLGAETDAGYLLPLRSTPSQALPSRALTLRSLSV